MKSGREITVPDNYHDEAVQMMSRFGDRFLYRADIGGRRGGKGLRVRVPVAYEMQAFLMQFVDLSLFFAAVRNVRIQRSVIRQPRTRDLAYRDPFLRKPPE
jgi:hypothetical protein